MSAGAASLLHRHCMWDGGSLVAERIAAAMVLAGKVAIESDLTTHRAPT